MSASPSVLVSRTSSSASLVPNPTSSASIPSEASPKPYPRGEGKNMPVYLTTFVQDSGNSNRQRLSLIFLLKRNMHLALLGLSAVFFLLVIYRFYLHPNTISTSSSSTSSIYPDQQSYWKYSTQKNEYRLAIIADMDKASKSGDGVWMSFLRRGSLKRQANGKFSMKWDPEPDIVYSKFSEAGRGMELSELSYFNGKLYSGDDRTGILYHLTSGPYAGEPTAAIPVHILMDGDGQSTKGFKIEWTTVKDGKLYIGSMGKEWVQGGIVKSNDPLWVKTMDKNGLVEAHNWEKIYHMLRVVTQTTAPGYLLHEAVSWNPIDRRWYFFPRRVSFEEYDDQLDEERCGNIAIWADENFSHFEVIKNIGPLNKIRGFSSFKFLPYSTEEVVALKSQEKDEVASYIMMINIRTGEVLLPETKIENVKYEGIEFL